jgi:hypothetical protein
LRAIRDRLAAEGGRCRTLPWPTRSRSEEGAARGTPKAKLPMIHGLPDTMVV